MLYLGLSEVAPLFSPPLLMVRRISGSGFELDQNKVQLRSPSALQGRVYYYLWCKCFSCLIRIDSVRFSCFCYVNNNQQNLIFSREIILVFSPSPSLRLPQLSSGPMANPSVHNTIYQYPLIQPQMITYQNKKKVLLKLSYISIIPQNKNNHLFWRQQFRNDWVKPLRLLNI